MALDVGEVAPTFTLPGIDGTTGDEREYALESFRGQPVVLVFYPGDNTPICTRQLNAYTDDVRDFADAGAQVLAISPQSVESHAGFARAQGGFAFPLLADEGKAVGQAYGVVGPVGF
ncbi:peroxiredoxin, partial [cyanobacterium TDX16]